MSVPLLSAILLALVASGYAASVGYDTQPNCPVSGEWYVDWDASYQCLSELSQPYPPPPGQIMPRLTVTGIIQTAGAAWTADNLVEAEGEICVGLMPQLSIAAMGAEGYREYCDPVLTSLREGTPLDAEAHCRLILNLTGVMESFMSGPVSTPQTEPRVEPTPEPIPFGIFALRPFDFEGELERIVVEQFGVTTDDFDSVCRARQNVVDSGSTLEELVTNFLVEFVKVLIPRGAEICNSWQDILDALQASPLMYGSVGPTINLSDLLNEVSDLVAHWTGYADRNALCQALNTAVSGPGLLDVTAADMVGNVLAVLTDVQQCSIIAQEGMDLALAYTPDLSSEILDLQIYQITGYHDAQQICQVISEAFQTTVTPTTEPISPTGFPEDGSVRIADGWTEFEGRVEVFYDGQWLPVCDNIWGIEEANVVCRQLGFDAAVAAKCCSQYGYSDLPGIFNMVECTGSEVNLLSCPHTEIGFGECEAWGHAGVVCRGELTPCPLPVGPTIDWDWVYQCAAPYYQEFENGQYDSPQVSGEIIPFLTTANMIDAAGAIWESEDLVQGLGQFCRLMAPRLTVLTTPDVFRVLCDPVLTALSDGTELDGEQICRLVYSMTSPIPYTGAPYTPYTDAPYTPGTATPSTPERVSTDYPFFNFTLPTPIICILPRPFFPYPSFSPGSPFGIDALRDFDFNTLLNQVVESVLNITAYDEDSICLAAGHLTNTNNPPRDIITDFMTEFLAGLYPRTAEICESWDEIAEAILSQTGDSYVDSVAGVLVDELPALIALWTDFQDRESLCTYIQSAIHLGGDAIDTFAGLMVQSILDVLTNQEKCFSLLNSALPVLAANIDYASLEMLESVYLPLYTGFDDVQQICQYTASTFNSRYPPLPVRLVGGETPNEGRVEVQYEGEWGTVCDDGFDNDDATVVCRALGYRGESLCLGNLDPGTGDILLDDLDCIGVESNIGQCPNPGIGIENCSHNEDVTVSCSLEAIPPILPTTQPETSSSESTTNIGFILTRLVGGSTENEGRLEVFYDGLWGTVCDDRWTDENTDVACRSLGFQGGEGYSAEFGEGSGNITLDDVVCTGDENSIAECRHNRPYDHNCQHYEDVGISCIPYDATTTAPPPPPPVPLIQVRLVGGSNEAEGRVEVLYKRTWGTVCDDSWDIDDANVVCHMLGYPGASGAPGRARFGEGSGTIMLDDVECTGSEDSLANCSHPPFSHHNCIHAEDAGVICNNPETAPVRLVGGSNEAEGRVELLYEGEWGTVCDDGWDLNDALVVCRMLGFQGASEATTTAQYGRGSGRILVDDAACSGHEGSLFDCGHTGPSTDTYHNCGHAEDAGVVCHNQEVVRLVGGSNEAEGRVEIELGGEWGTVCDDQWDLNDAHVVCRMLGYPGAAATAHAWTASGIRFGQGTGSIFLDDVICSGNEESIFDCQYPGIGVHNCVHNEDTGVICNRPTVRLVGGRNEAEGRVEVHLDGEWGTICDDLWDLNDANVVCRMLGFQSAYAAPTRARFGQGTDRILLDDVMCLGDEESLFDCHYSAIGVHNCVHSEDAGVICI